MQICGYIERITFQNTETGFTVAQLKIPQSKEPVCVVGTLPLVRPGETLRCFGEWKNHLIHGRQFEVSECRVEAPADVIGIKKYLGSGLVKGIGPAYASRIVGKFGADTLRIIDESPEKLLEVEGLGRKRLDKITACWVEQKSIREVMIFLQSHGVSPSYAQKIFKTYGEASIEKVKNNPFYLAREIFGIGFKTADKIAQKLGIPHDAPQRIEAGIEFALYELANDGHVCYPVDEFFTAAEQMLEVSKNLIEGSVERLKKEDRIELFDIVHVGQLKKFIWARSYFNAEVGIAKELLRLRNSRCALRQVDVEKALEWVQKTLGIKLAANQLQAVGCSLADKVQVITGGPGTGKSTITKAILAITGKLTKQIVLAAPTGRAAKRMSEITGCPASTIHSLLEFDFKLGRFKRNREEPLECDLLVVDEASMIDTHLMYNLLKAIPNHARLILVGDINQLPSVGPGNVLKDIISSRSIPVTMLNEIFRQAAGSKIITNAHRINQGVFPDINTQSDSDFFFIPAESGEDVLANILALVAQRLPKKYGLDPMKDIQVLAPMRKGIIGIDNLNVAMQHKLNPNGQALMHNGRQFNVGDKVMQLRNDYQKEVFNGDIGRIREVDTAEQQLLVTFDEKDVVYEFSDLNELALAYAVSIHKYQGSECPCIVIPIHTSHFKLLTRNLLYTGVTRGKRLVVLVGTKKALGIAVRNDDVKKRYTGLEQALLGTLF